MIWMPSRSLLAVMASCHTAAVQHNRNLVALMHIGSAGNDLNRLLADIYLADDQLIRIRMTLNGKDLSDDDLVQVCVQFFKSLPPLVPVSVMASVYSCAVTSSSGTYALIQDKCMYSFFLLPPILELFQETDVVFVQQSHVVNLIFQKCDTLQTYAESKAGVFFRIDTAHFKYMGMNHTAAEDLNPAAALAETAAASAAFEAGHIHLGAGLREGEVMGTEFRLGLRSEKLFRELCQSTFKVCKGDAFVYNQALDLMEGRRMGSVHLIGTVTHVPGKAYGSEACPAP